jgi:hypothetical protein
VGWAIDLTGMRFARLLVLAEAPRRGRHRYWICRCDCGCEKQVAAGSLRSGRSHSCGCWQRELAAVRRGEERRGEERRGKERKGEERRGKERNLRTGGAGGG